MFSCHSLTRQVKQCRISMVLPITSQALYILSQVIKSLSQTSSRTNARWIAHKRKIRIMHLSFKAMRSIRPMLTHQTLLNVHQRCSTWEPLTKIHTIPCTKEQPCWSKPPQFTWLIERTHRVTLCKPVKPSNQKENRKSLLAPWCLR